MLETRKNRVNLKGFTDQWRKEYLQSLREQSKSSKESANNVIKVGDIVLLKDEKSARSL